MRWFRPKWVIRRIFQAFFGAVLSVLVLVAFIVFLYSRLPVITVAPIKYSPIRLVSLDQAPQKHISIAALSAETRESSPLSPSHLSHSPSVKRGSYLQQGQYEGGRGGVVSSIGGGIASYTSRTGKCSFYTCFNISRCGLLEQDSLTVYIYPVEKIFVDGRPVQDQLSREFYQVIHAIRNSPYYISDPNKACIFVPTVDFLNLQSVNSRRDIKTALSNLEFWGEAGENHLLFNFFPGSFPLTDISDAAIVAASNFPPGSFRPGFHVPIISFSPNLGKENISASDSFLGRKILAVSTQGYLKADQVGEDVLLLNLCPHQPSNFSIRCLGSQIYHYPQVLMKTDFCIVLKNMVQPTLWDVMSVDCIPVIITDFERLPFDDLIDWRRNAILLYENQIGELSSILRSVSPERRRRLKSQVQFTFKKYFQTIDRITNTVLEAISNRIFVHNSHTVEQWNMNPQSMIRRSPIFSPAVAAKTPGFTAVILAYDRMPSLLQVIERVATVPSLAKILVVWNNQVKKPPGALAWPKILKPLKIIQTGANRMSNRFYPYDEIETEAVFSVDDDIIMLTPDEIEFAFEAWLEFPDRIVGFPSRSHVWDNSTGRWKYESEWTNEISMVLTGAAFYHKFWHHAYTYQLPEEIRQWVDAKMNCEDIAMNFLVSHHTGKAPIKVTPRKKFKCPTCVSNEMLSTDSGHMVERTDCINKFTQVYGYMPLLPVEFRADPVLFRVDNLPAKMKRFDDIGSL